MVEMWLIMLHFMPVMLCRQFMHIKMEEHMHVIALTNNGASLNSLLSYTSNKIMLIICRIVVHLHDRQKTTVILPFNSSAKYGGSRDLATNYGPACWGAVAATLPLAPRLQERTQLLTFSSSVINILLVFVLQCLLSPRKLCPLSHLRRGRTSLGESLSHHQRSKTMISGVLMKVPPCRSFARR